MGRNHQPLIDTFLRNEIPAWSRRFSESSHPNGYSFHVFKTYSLRALIFLYSYHSQTLNVLLGSLAKSLSPKHCTASFTGIGIYISFLLLPFSFSKYLHIISICSLFCCFRIFYLVYTVTGPNLRLSSYPDYLSFCFLYQTFQDKRFPELSPSLYPSFV